MAHPLTVLAPSGQMFDNAVRAAHAAAGREIVMREMYEANAGRQRLRASAERELVRFLDSDEARAAQDRGVARSYRIAVARATRWAQDARGASEPSAREIATFYDLQVMHGGNIHNVWSTQAQVFRSSFANDGEMVAWVGDWLRTCPESGAVAMINAREAKANADVWSHAVPRGRNLEPERGLLFAFGFLQAVTSQGPRRNGGQVDQQGAFKANVMSRRGTIALGVGRANGEEWPGID